MKIETALQIEIAPEEESKQQYGWRWSEKQLFDTRPLCQAGSDKSMQKEENEG